MKPMYLNAPFTLEELNSRAIYFNSIMRTTGEYWKKLQEIKDDINLFIKKPKNKPEWLNALGNKRDQMYSYLAAVNEAVYEVEEMCAEYTSVEHGIITALGVKDELILYSLKSGEDKFNYYRPIGKSFLHNQPL